MYTAYLVLIQRLQYWKVEPMWAEMIDNSTVWLTGITATSGESLVSPRAKDDHDVQVQKKDSVSTVGGAVPRTVQVE